VASDRDSSGSKSRGARERANTKDSGRTDPQGETRRRISREQGEGRGSVFDSTVGSYVCVIDREQARGETLEPGSAL